MVWKRPEAMNPSAKRMVSTVGSGSDYLNDGIFSIDVEASMVVPRYEYKERVSTSDERNKPVCTDAL